MKKPILLLYIAVAFILNVQSQPGQFAVVKPNGTTQVFASWTSAYAGAVDGDYIYLPGVTISDPVMINKKLFIYGAGHHPDSTTATSRTIFSSTILIQSEATGGLLEGIKASIIILGGANKLSNYTIKRCNTYWLDFDSPNTDSLPDYISVSESIVNTMLGNNSGNNALKPKYSTFYKNIFISHVKYFQLCTFKNNIFLNYQTSGAPCQSLISSAFENNIFLSSDPTPSGYQNCSNIYLNNLKISNPVFPSSESCPSSQENNLSVPSENDIFITYAAQGFHYDYNYHLKPTCPGVGAGTDGTDVGIYGTINPTVEGWITSNPHIFFKQVDPETGPDGKLHIQLGVRANNN